MVIVKIKGYEINSIIVKDSFYRRAIQFSNIIITNLKKVGVDEDDIELDVPRLPIRKEPATVNWYMDGHNMYYSYKLAGRYVDNLYVISKLIEKLVDDLIDKKITVEEFISSFREDEDYEKERINARKILEIEESENDMNVINKAYKNLAKKYHPDMMGGDDLKFKEINKAHKIIKRELM